MYSVYRSMNEHGYKQCTIEKQLKLGIRQMKRNTIYIHCQGERELYHKISALGALSPPL